MAYTSKLERGRLEHWTLLEKLGAVIIINAISDDTWHVDTDTMMIII
jgi:hypothetical protein